MNKKDVCIALDFNSSEETFKFLDLFKDEKLFVKVGMELFYSEGPDIIRKIKDRGHDIFLDLKLCDIPNTVNHAMASLGKLGVDVINVHAYGSVEMMKAAREGFYSTNDGSGKIIAVTILTSIDENVLNKELFISKPLRDTVTAYALNAKKADLSGVVCSALEAGLIHETCGDDFLTVTPGIRFETNTKDDQKRVITPIGARRLGSDIIVVGRPITKALDPIGAYNKCKKDFLNLQ